MKTISEIIVGTLGLLAVTTIAAVMLGGVIFVAYAVFRLLAGLVGV